MARARKALIPAAGRGTRFLPVTKAVPKELLPIVSTPALELVVAEAARNDLTDVVLVLSAGKQSVADYFAPNPDLEAALEAKNDHKRLADLRRISDLATIHQVDQAIPRGLGDAIAEGEQFAGGEPLAVLLPDDLIDEREQLLGRMLDVQAERGGIVVALMEVEPSQISLYGCAAIDGDAVDDVVRIVDLVEKPAAGQAPSNLAIIGRYVLPPEIFDALRATAPGAGGEIQITDAMRALVLDGTPVHGLVFHGRRYDTGDRLDYLRAVVQLAGRHPEVGAEFTAWLRDHVASLDAAEGSPS